MLNSCPMLIPIDQWQRIRHDNPPRDRCRALLNHLFSIHHPRAFLVLREALSRDTHYLLDYIDNHVSRYGIREQLNAETCSQDEIDSKPKKVSAASKLSEQSKEITLLRNEIKIEKSEKESLQLLIEQLRITINKETQANKALKEALDEEKIAKRDSGIDTEKLKQDLDNNRTTICTLELNSAKLKQELDAGNMTNKSLWAEFDQLKEELDQEIIARFSAQTDRDILKQDLDKEKLANSSLVEKVKVYKTSIKTLESNVEKLKQKLETIKRDNLRYNSDPVLVQTIKTEVGEKEKKRTFGLTILDKELFVLSQRSSEVEVYDSTRLSFSRIWNFKELVTPRDIGSCSRNKCVYIFDYKFTVQPAEILRVDPNGNLIKKWPTGDGNCRLYVTSESNIILTGAETHTLKEYSSDGRLIRKVDLFSSADILSQFLAVKLANGQFVVSHGRGDDELHRVCVVDAAGKLIKSFGGKRGSDNTHLDRPAYFIVDGNGFVIVADRGNSRVLLLDSDLKFKREILSKEKHGLRDINRIFLDESTGRIFVADHEWDFTKMLGKAGRILVFSFEPTC